MEIEILKSKIHRATITETNLDYEGSITIDPELYKAAGMLFHEKVLIVNLNNGNRFETYIIEGEKGKREICINGAAAHLCNKGDIVIIMSFAKMSQDEAKQFNATIVKVDSNNNIIIQ